jgi:CBS domain-containing protein
MHMKLATAIKLTVPDAASAVMADFLSVGNALPDDQDVVSVEPRTPVGDAVRLMREGDFSQVPVTVDRAVVGVFTYGALASVLADADVLGRVAELPVDGFLVTPHYVRVTDRFDYAVVRWLDEDDYVLVGEPERLQGVLTSVDVLRHLYRASQRFVLLNEIEIGLRELIRTSVDDTGLAVCIQNCVARGARAMRPRLEDMVFSNYTAIITDMENWPRFAKVFGGIREVVYTKLESIRKLRNDIFHFKRPLTNGDHRQLIGFSAWIISRQRIAQKGGY